MPWTQKAGELPQNGCAPEPEDTGVKPSIFADVYWQQVNGQLPYRPHFNAIEPPTGWVMFPDEIPRILICSQPQELNDCPIGLWKIDEDTEYMDDKPYKKDIPYKEGFPEMCGIDDAPASLWIIIEGSSYNKDTPYKKDIPFRSSFPAMYKPRKEKPPKYKKFIIQLDSYRQVVPIMIKSEQSVTLEEYKSTIVTE